MGSLQKLRSPRSFTLAGRSLLGRSPSADCVIASRQVSGEHASIWWAEGAWWIRDLGSHNGTRLDEQPLLPGRAARLSPGARLSFGHPEELWVWMEDGPPVLVARSEEDEVVGSTEILALPSEERVEASVFRDRSGSWWLESDSEAYPVQSGQVVRVADRSWRLQLPLSIPRTQESETPAEPAEAPEWAARFTVSSDEEFAQLHLEAPDGASFSLTPRVFHYTLLTLARTRLADQDEGHDTPGWRSVEELCRDLRIDRAELNQHVYRARKQARGVSERTLPELVERRPLSDQLRFALAGIRIQTS